MLSALLAENAKPRDKAYMLADGNGLHLLVKPHGTKLWRLRYRFGGKQDMLSPGHSLTCRWPRPAQSATGARKLMAQG